ncbi:MAG: IS1595 family transposase, partial [Clostridiales bacterium]|nr:IS1595 family transposase [Clostridiales bacterium]
MSKRKKISIVEFTRRYSTEEACREHLAEQRWPEG